MNTRERQDVEDILDECAIDLTDDQLHLLRQRLDAVDDAHQHARMLDEGCPNDGTNEGAT